MVATPATIEGSRSISGLRSTRVLSHASANDNGGVISASVCTIENTPGRLRVDTIQYVASSSAKTLWPRMASRSAVPTAISASTTHRARDGRATA